jgi:hypothetical protein
MRSDGREDLQIGRLILGPWWLSGIMAVFLGFGTVQDNVRRLDESAGWGLVGRWLLIAGGAAILVVYGWSAVAKFRVRHRG